jgi:hypothetical protein
MGPLSEKDDLSIMERVARFSSREISIAWDRIVVSALLLTVV